MKRVLFISLLALLGLCNLHAQTLKNIHRKNLPTLHIPMHLIDKVETVLDGNIRKLKITQTDGFVSLILTADIDSITHSEGQAVNPEQLGNLRTASVFGVVRNDLGNPVPLALVKSAYSSNQTYTDVNGVFFLNDFVVYNKLGFITIEKSGYFSGSRSFLPLENGANRVEIQLLPKTISGTFNSISGGQVTAGSLQMTFPINAIVQANGQPYAGTVNVFARALDPSSQEMFDQMPGDLLGGLNDSLRLLRSFGMAAVELFDSNIEPLQLASGQNVAMRFTIPTSMLNEAPETIDWWSFDEEAGYWKHEGTSQKNGNEYLGQASHFSWWNVDVPDDFVELVGEVKDNEGNPIGGARIVAESQTFGTGLNYTNNEGIFSGYVPINQNITLNIKLICTTTNDWILAHSENIQIQNTDINQQYIASLDQFYPITGIVVNCEGQPVTSGYVKMGLQVFITSNGAFTIQTCATGNYSIRAFDISNPDSIKAGLPLLVQVSSSGATTGNLEACSQNTGIVMDIDGNVYQTILIGSQWWMAENLRTSKFSDGSVIPYIADDQDWSFIFLEEPGTCDYNNNPDNVIILGKLYNGYAVQDSRNVCPSGWHVSSDSDWNILINYLDTNAVLNIIGNQSLIAGGKLKTAQGWEVPNIDATNESGFSATAGGFRKGVNGLFYNVGRQCWFWSSTNTQLSSFAWLRILSFDHGYVERLNLTKRYGLSVRCTKD